MKDANKLRAYTSLIQAIRKFDRTADPAEHDELNIELPHGLYRYHRAQACPIG